MIDLINKLNFSLRAKLPVVLQSEGAECGLACLCMIGSYYGHKLDLISLRRKFSISLKGATVKQLISIANQLALIGRPMRLELEQLKQCKLPLILHWDMCHFVVLKSVGKDGVWIHDPARGAIKCSWEQVSRSFTGVAIELRPSESFEPVEAELSLGFSLLWRKITGLKRSLGQVMLLSLVMQCFLLIAPYFVQLVVDNVIVTNDFEFLWMLGVGFSLLLLLQVATKGVRAWVILYMRSIMGIQLVANMMRHLLRLPMNWFDKRFVGDVLSRFQSLDYIKRLLSDGFVEGMLDGLMAVLTLSIMFFLSPWLAVITLVSVSLFTFIRTMLFAPLRNNTKESLQLKAACDSLFYESVRSVQPVKVFNGEASRQAKLENAQANWINADVKVGRLNIMQLTAKDFVYGFEYILLIWVGALFVLQDSMTVGLLFAFLAYRQQFASSSQLFLDKLFEWRMMGLHLSRIADIALSEPEEALDSDYPMLGEVKGRLELNQIAFQYDKNEPFLFKNLNLTVEAGECVVLTAPSGFGKTSLIKLMMGLSAPTQGKVLLDGIDIRKMGLVNYRSEIAAVMQGDTLLSGSIADNICFFANEQDPELMESVCQQAQILDDIKAMPMGFNSLAGDMGSTLSGGQVQRVLIARALYKRPKVLFLDEASSALDKQTEKKINQVLKQLGITRIMIAHRQETIDMADRIINLPELISDSVPPEQAPPRTLVAVK
ncbi:peptidase domain-containing ABC transporter [Pseudoalteromonas sp. R3]|uniref:peptidase domain-containing ABC transporter n=2 Tax=Pseudoalteromonas sp. R3 TaxID=1709477 RepID=UPI0006B42F18|nr:peptidase domain-containing ABC transporter [Pseudoalteromonas sp. R3]